MERATLGGLAAAAATGQVILEVSGNKVTAGESIQLTVRFRGVPTDGFEGLRVPEGIEIISESRSSSFQLINGRSSSETTFIYDVLVRRQGTFNIGPVEVAVSGQKIVSNSVQITAGLPGGSASGAGSAAGEGAGDGVATAGITGPQILTSLSSQTVFVGQSLVLTIELRHRDGDGQINYRDLRLQGLGDFSITDLNKPEQSEEVENGIRIGKIKILKRLTPMRPGAYVLSDISVTSEVLTPIRRSGQAGFFDSVMPQYSRQIKALTADPLPLEVLPLPVDGRPQGFSGLVGETEINIRFDGEGRSVVQEGDSLGLVVQMASSGDLSGITVVPPGVPKNLKIYEDAGRLMAADDSSIKNSVREYRFAVVPVQAGEAQLEPFTFSYFDPAHARYVVFSKTFDPFTVEGDNGVQDVVASTSNAAADPTRVDSVRDLMPIKMEQGAFQVKGQLGEHFLVALVGPLFGLIFWFVSLMARGYLENLPVISRIFRRRTALSRAHRALRQQLQRVGLMEKNQKETPNQMVIAQNVLRIVREFFSDRTGVAAAQRTIIELQEAYSKDPVAIAHHRFWSVLRTFESMVYSPEQMGDDLIRTNIELLVVELETMDRGI
jgi:hypothetical protein